MTRLVTPPATFAAALSALLLAGCASTHGLAPESAPRDPDTLTVAETFRGTLSAPAWPKQDWWTAFGDPQLDTLMREALAQSPGLAITDARVRKAQSDAGLAEEARRAGLKANAQYSGAYLPETLVPEAFGGGKYLGVELIDVGFAYAPDLWGGKRAHWESAVGKLHAAEVDAQQARLQLSANIVRAYIALDQAYAAQALAQRERERAQAALDLARKRVRAGLDNTQPMRVAESAVAAATQQTDAAQQQIDALRNALATLAGQGPDRGLRIDAPHLSTADAPSLPSLLPSELLGHRPDVVAARWRVEAAARGIDEKKAEFYPSINLTAMAGLAAGRLSDLFDRNAAFATGGPAISLPIFSGRRLRAQLAGSDADYDLAVAQYEQTVLGALREVADALQAARQLDAQIAATTQARDAVARAQGVAESRFRAGLATRIDALNAQRPVIQYDQQLAALRAQRRNVAADLAVALGGGLSPLAPSSTSPAAMSASQTGKPTP